MTSFNKISVSPDTLCGSGKRHVVEWPGNYPFSFIYIYISIKVKHHIFLKLKCMCQK